MGTLFLGAFFFFQKGMTLLPLYGIGDSTLWEFQQHFFSKNLFWNGTFFDLNLNSQDVIYPYHVNGVFQPWSLEREFLGTFFLKFFPTLSFLNLYFIVSLIISSIGSFAILRRSAGNRIAAFAALFLGFGNVFSFSHYPGHYSFTALHWMNLVTLLTFENYRKLMSKQTPSWNAILCNALLAVLLLGLDLGYVAGFGLTFGVITAISCAVMFFIRFKNEGRSAFRIPALQGFNGLSILLILSILSLASLYLPLLLKIKIESEVLSAGRVYGAPYWTNPLRNIMPYLSTFLENPSTLDNFFKDSGHGFGPGGVGLAFFIAGCLGVSSLSKKTWMIYLPVLVMMIVCIVHHPSNFSILNVFPWFKFHRISARNVLIIPVLIIILFAQEKVIQQHNKKSILVLLLIASVALFEVQQTFFSAEKNKESLILPTDQKQFFKSIKETSKNALFEWPFCIIGGNGATGNRLCPGSHLLTSQFTLARYHENRTLSGYYGRLYPEMVSEVFKDGWEFLLQKDGIHRKDNACLSEADKTFMKQFIRSHKFTGLLIYEDLLSPLCAADIVSSLGTPHNSTSITGFGKVSYWALSSEPEVEKPLTSVALAAEGSQNFDLLRNAVYGTALSGIRNLDSDPQRGEGRWIQDPLEIELFLDKERPLQIQFDYWTLAKNPTLKMEWNQSEVPFKTMSKAPINNVTIELKGRKGHNKLKIDFGSAMSWLDFLGTPSSNQARRNIDGDFLSRFKMHKKAVHRFGRLTSLELKLED
jgi:hypothetical protein